MKHLLTLALLLFAFGHHVSAKAYFETKEQMIERAEVIAIITVSDVRDSDDKGQTWIYRKSATARTETVLKGSLPDEFRIHGNETFICAQCPLIEGRQLVFLKKDKDLWTGSNWHLSFRPITGSDVAWYKSDEDRYNMAPTPLEKVLAEIKEIMARPKKSTEKS